MSDRNTPIKFGPEWLRNLARERSAARTDNQGHRPAANPASRPASSATRPASSANRPAGPQAAATEAGGAPRPAPSHLPATSSATTTYAPCGSTNIRNSQTNPVSRVRLARRRYGREEMLALCERTSEPPSELKQFDLLYQPREKQPFALNAFDEEVRDNVRSGPPPNTMPPERFGPARGVGRGVLGGVLGGGIEQRTEPRGRGRLQYLRQASTHVGSRNPLPMHTGVRMPGFGTGVDEEAAARPWSASNGAIPKTTEQPEWAGSKPYRSRRHNNHTNWRQTSRDEGDEWRNMEGGGGRPHARSGQDKWGTDREWGESDRRPAQERPTSWSAHRRGWPAGDAHHTDDSLPEWAMDNIEAGAGTFDSTGAFHGYSNDDSDLPKPESSYPMTRSHTHGSFARSRAPEEDSEEWWASEKAKKLSPKRFDVGDMKPKKAAVPFSGEQRVHPGAAPHRHDDDDERAEQPDPGQAAEPDKKVFQYLEDAVAQAQRQSISTMMRNLTLNKPAEAETTPPQQSAAAAGLGPARPLQTSTPVHAAMPSPALPPPAPLHAAGMLPGAHLMPLSQAFNSDLIVLPALIQRQALPPALHSRGLMGRYPPSALPAVPALNNSLFAGLNNAQAMQAASEIPLASQEQSSLYNNPIGMSYHTSESLESLYNSIMGSGPDDENPADQWYYEDPKKQIQGPFSSKEMFYWYKAGFFSPSLMVRRACETLMRPLGSYGPVVPFAYFVEMQNFRMSPYEQPPPAAHELLHQHQQRSVIDDALWGQPGSTQDFMWTQSHVPERDENGVNNLPMFFWDPEPNGNAMTLPADIMKEMKTEDQILAQLRAAQGLPAPPGPAPAPAPAPPAPAPPAPAPPAPAPAAATPAAPAAPRRASPGLEALQQIIRRDQAASASDSKSESDDSEASSERIDKTQPTAETPATVDPQTPPEAAPAPKPAKPPRIDAAEKPARPKETNNAPKNKNKKIKEEKIKDDRKEEIEVKNREEDIKLRKASVESSPTKSKKEEKQSKKELEKEKKEWLKEGFTLVKGPEKNSNKENKKKAEEAKALEELDKKKKEEDRITTDTEKTKKQLENVKKQQELQQQRQLSESLSKRAPWAAAAAAGPPGRAGVALAEIQRLEREKKLEQIREQQHMMHLIAQQQAAALAREQEIQANLAWAKNNMTNNGIGPTLAEIQAETRRQAAAHSLEDMLPLPPLPTGALPWGAAANGVGFWDTPPAGQSAAQPAAQPTGQPGAKSDKPQEPDRAKPKDQDAKPKRKLAVAIGRESKRESSPASEFEAWCGSALALWRAQIDVPTFVGFLKDIESPYEVKDYVKCYLGDTKDSNDFARQFLERRSKLLRVGTVTPSDDLCSPALAVNPRPPLSDYQEVKGKGKKSKKNKMLKVDARILGFSVTASEDRINVGDIDTA